MKLFMRVHRSTIAGILFSFIFTACVSSPENLSINGQNAWAKALRALDPADTPTPAYDITAVYLDRDIENLQIRIDLLDFKNPNELSLDIRIRNDSDPEAIPLDIHIPSESDATRISFDPALDTVIVDIPLSEIPSRPRVDVSTPEDRITGLSLDSPVPNDTAPLLLTFYDTFAGRFPAEALRSWDGAHTGPRGERHGLKHLLDAVEEYQIPTVLLDLKNPKNLSALDAMGAIPRIQKLTEQDLLILPEIAHGSYDNEQFVTEQQRIMAFGFPLSPFLYVPNPDPWSKYDYRFTLTDDPSHLYHWIRFPTDNIIYIPLGELITASQPKFDGPSLDIRRALLETALNEDRKDLLVLSNSLLETTWGNSEMVDSMFAYFASRPYIEILNQKDLLNFPTIFGRPGLLHKQSDETVANMENFYAVAHGHVTDYANFWVERLTQENQVHCDRDIDWDNQVECVLANENYLAILNPQGARLTYLFTRDGENLHQLIGPSWQVAVGLSSPYTWDISVGEAADSGAFPGAFADADDPFKAYKPAIEGNTLTFTSLDGSRTKIFKLTENGIDVKYKTQETVTIQIPLLVEPESRFMPSWAQKYVGQKNPGGVIWGLVNGPRVSVQAEGPAKMRAFNESLSLLSIPEDPDFSYPSGHTIPFPMAVVEVEITGDYSLSIERR